MNTISKIILIAVFLGISNQSCVNQSKPSQNKEISTKSDSLTGIIKGVDGLSINSNIVLNNTFYKIENIDSRDIIKDNYSDGIDGIAFDSTRISYFGSEEWRIMYFGMATKQMVIDSIIIKGENLHLFLSLSYKTPAGDLENYYDEIKIQPIKTKPGYILVNDEITLVDSLHSVTLPIIKETLEDLKEAIGDF